MDIKKVAVIGGSGLEGIFRMDNCRKIKSPYGISQPICKLSDKNHKFTFLPRHGLKHETPPHKVNYRANLWSLRKIGVERIISTNAVGAIDKNYWPGDFVVPSDIIDFTRLRSTTFYDEKPVIHVDMTNPYCPELRESVKKSTKKVCRKYWHKSVLAATDGPRFETPAEIRMMRKMGCDVVGMTGSPEVFLARELGMCYSAICFVSNRAAGMQSRLTTSEVIRMAKKSKLLIMRIIEDVLNNLPKEKKCLCSKSIEYAKM